MVQAGGEGPSGVDEEKGKEGGREGGREGGKERNFIRTHRTGRLQRH